MRSSPLPCYCLLIIIVGGLQQQNAVHINNIRAMGQEIHTQDERLVHKFNQVRNKMARNRLILVSILNALTFLSFVFAMAFYQWVWIELDFNENTKQRKIYYFWVNLLYLKQDAPGSEYENFSTAQRRLCGPDIYCKATFFSFAFVGYLSFSIFVIAGCLQMFDFVRIFYYIVKSGYLMEKKDNFRHIVTISTYMVGLTLSAFSMLIVKYDFHFGVSFWLCIGTLIVFVLVIVYEQFSIRKMIKQSLIQELLNRELEERARKMKETTIEMQERSQKEEGLTL